MIKQSILTKYDDKFMYSSQLLIVLKSLAKEDLLQFEKMLHSPYFHQKKPSSELLNFWRYLKKGLEKKGETYFEKRRVYEALFPEKKIIKTKLEKLMTQLFALVKSFLIFQQLEQQTGEKAKLLCLMTAFSNLHLQSSFDQTYRKLKNSLQEEQIGWNSAFFYEKFLIQSKISEFQSLYNDRKGDLNLANTHASLDLYYLVRKLEYTIQLLARDRFVFPVKWEESIHTLNAIIPTFHPQQLEIPLVRIYLSAYQWLQAFHEEEGEKHHGYFNQLLKEYADVISYEQLKMLQTLNRNHHVLKYQQGDTNYLERTFQLYQEHLLLGFLYQEGQILPAMLSNITLIGLRNKAFEWVYQFLVDHKNLIGGTNTPEIVFQYNLAQYYFSIQEYDKALDCITFTYDDPFYKIAARRLEVKILFETDSEIFDDKLKAFKLYTYRLTPVSTHFKNKVHHQNFVDLLKQIRRPKTYKNQTRIEKLLQKARKSKHLADKEWIIEKLEAMQ